MATTFTLFTLITYITTVSSQIIPMACIGKAPTRGPCVELGLQCSGSSDLDPAQCAAWQAFLSCWF